MSRRRRSKQRAARARKRRARRTTPTYENLSASSRVDVQVSSGPYGNYLHGLAATVGDRAWVALRDLSREAWVADLLLAAHAVPFRDSLHYAAFRAARDAGLSAIEVDEATRLNINRLVRGVILKRTARVEGLAGDGATRRRLGTPHSE